MIRIAYYGKGGIGKSTVAANISGILGAMGKKVLHIGCDPKADSTRLLAKEEIEDVLSKLKNGDIKDYKGFVYEGKHGVHLVEVGGPIAGIGCAGLGITTALEMLTDLGVYEMDWDVIAYDVLGDVVCGGFAVPIKKHFVDVVQLVTSSNYMSIYAANNIMKCVEMSQSKKSPIELHLVGNHISSPQDEEILQKFCDRTKVETFFHLAESDLVKQADYLNQLLIDFAPQSQECKELQKIAEETLKGQDLYFTKSLSKEELDQFRRSLFE